MTITATSAVVGLIIFVLLSARNQWVYRNMLGLVGKGYPPEVFIYGYDWMMTRFWKWNFQKGIAEFMATRLNPKVEMRAAK